MQVTTFVGLDIGSEVHVLAAVDAQGDVVHRPVRCAEDADYGARYGNLTPARGLLAELQHLAQWVEQVLPTVRGGGERVRRCVGCRQRRVRRRDTSRDCARPTLSKSPGG